MSMDKDTQIENALYDLSGIAGVLVALSGLPQNQDAVDGPVLMLLHDGVCRSRDRIAAANGFDVVPGTNPDMGRVA